MRYRKSKTNNGCGNDLIKKVNDEENLKKKYNCNKRLRFIKMKVAKGGLN